MAHSDTLDTLPLASLKLGEMGQVHRIVETGPDDPVARRLVELGFDDGIDVELLHQGPFGANPLAVRVGTNTVALRRSEAGRVRLIRKR